MNDLDLMMIKEDIKQTSREAENAYLDSENHKRITEIRKNKAARLKETAEELKLSYLLITRGELDWTNLPNSRVLFNEFKTRILMLGELNNGLEIIFHMLNNADLLGKEITSKVL